MNRRDFLGSVAATAAVGQIVKMPLPSTLSLKWAERVPHHWLDTGGEVEIIALSRGERVSRSGAFTSRSGTGEGVSCSLSRINLFRSGRSSFAKP